MDDMMDDPEQAGEVGEQSAPYWPADNAMRLECLRLAVGATAAYGNDSENTLSVARRFHAFVSGEVEVNVDINIEIP